MIVFKRISEVNFWSITDPKRKVWKKNNQNFKNKLLFWNSLNRGRTWGGFFRDWSHNLWLLSGSRGLSQWRLVALQWQILQRYFRVDLVEESVAEHPLTRSEGRHRRTLFWVRPPQRYDHAPHLFYFTIDRDSDRLTGDICHLLLWPFWFHS